MNPVRFPILGNDYEHGGAASRSLKEQLKKVGADPAAVRRAMIAAYEAEMNVVIHARRGELRAAIERGRLDVEVTDEGPGIPDVEAALRPGFSTASAQARELGFGAGMGLPNIRKNSDEFTIESTVGRGTCVRFGILLRPQALYGVGRHSLHIAAEKCRQSFRCIHACPTQALRVFRGKPAVLDYLCIDCTACLAICPSGALTMSGAANELRPDSEAVLVVPSAVLAQFGSGVPSAVVLQELDALGFGEVWITAAAEAGLRDAVVEYARGDAPVRPVISPACPSVVNLVEMRFPSLIPHLAPFGSALAALREECAQRRAVFVVTCPGQSTALGGEGTRHEAVSPAALRAAVLPRLSHAPSSSRLPQERPVAGAAVCPEPAAREQGWRAEGGVLRVTGLDHVVRVLNAIEDGLASDLAVVEPWACDEGCLGSPLLADDPYLASDRLATVRGFGPARVAGRQARFAPRPGLRLDEDMNKAIEKLARIDKLRRSLPGSDCGWCGAPTCAALAEDIVRGRAARDACVRQALGKEGPA